MASYTLKLTPSTVTFDGEGSLDETLVNGASIQRTGYIEVPNGDNRKIVAILDGVTFDDTMETLADNVNIEVVGS